MIKTNSQKYLYAVKDSSDNYVVGSCFYYKRQVIKYMEELFPSFDKKWKWRDIYRDYGYRIVKVKLIEFGEND